MDIFKQKKNLVLIIIVLSLLNLFMIGAFMLKDFFHKPPPPLHSQDQHEVSNILQKDLGLTEKQAEQIDKLRSDFFEKEQFLSAQISAGRDSMNMAMFNKITDEDLVKSLAKKIADNEYRMELLRFEQAKQFKLICTPEQMDKFEGLVKEVRDYFKPENQPKRK